jgi:hypothetical protein
MTPRLVVASLNLTNFVIASPPLFPCQALAWWLLFPIGPNIDLVPTASTLGADHAAFEVRDFGFSRVAPHIDQRDVAAGIVQARCDETLHAQVAHVTERHRWSGGLLLFSHPSRLSE